MILRLLRGRTTHSELDGLVAIVREDFDAWAANDTGPASALTAQRALGDDEPGDAEFLLVSTWAAAEKVLARGGELSRPLGRLDTSPGLRAARAQHYELMMGISRGDERPGEVLRLSSIALTPTRSSAFYGHVRWLWEEYVGDAGLVALHVGRRAAAAAEEAVVVSVWESQAALDAAVSEGFVGGDVMGAFYANEPSIEHFTVLTLQHRDI